MGEYLYFDIIRTRRDHVRARRAIMRRNKVLMAVWLVCTLVISLLLFSVILAALEGSTDSALWRSVTAFVGMYLGGIGLFYYALPAIAVGFSRIPDAASHVMVDNYGIAEREPLLYIDSKWEFYTPAWETRSYIFLSRGRTGYRFYPKRMLESVTVKDFREYIRANVAKAKLRKDQRTMKPVSGKQTNFDAKAFRNTILELRNDTILRRQGGIKFNAVMDKIYYTRVFRSASFFNKETIISIIATFLLFLYFITDDIKILYASHDFGRFLSETWMILIFLAVIPLWQFYYYPRRVARTATNIGVVFDAVAYDSGITVRSSVANSIADWTYFTSVRETADDFILFARGGGFRAFPKHSFESPQDIERFRQMIRKHIPKVRLLEASN